MRAIMSYLVKNDDAFFYLEYLYANNILYSRAIPDKDSEILIKFVDENLAYEHFIKKGLFIIKYYKISSIGADFYKMAQAIREGFDNG